MGKAGEPSDEGGGSKGEVMVPKSELEDAIKRRKNAVTRAETAEAELERIREEQRQKEEAAKKEQGKWETLYNEAKAKITELTNAIEGLKAKEAQVTTVLEEAVNVELAAIPEDTRGLVPDALSALDKLNYISKNRAVLSRTDTTKKPADSNERVGPQDGKPQDAAGVSAVLGDKTKPLGTRIAEALRIGSGEK